MGDINSTFKRKIVRGLDLNVTKYQGVIFKRFQKGGVRIKRLREGG